MSNTKSIIIAMLLASALFVGAVAVFSASADAHYKGGCEPVPDVDDASIYLGLIGYYESGENILSTSIDWLELKAGDSIDWDAVDAAYDGWVAGGGLEPDRTIWQTSGFASFTFEDYALVGFSDFTNDQLEGYYLQYYVDPGYIYYAPINLGFVGYYLYDGIVMSTSFYWQVLKAGESIDWDAVDAAYDGWVAIGGLEPDRTIWQTSGAASFTFEDYAEVGYTDFTNGQLESFYQQFYLDPGYIYYPPIYLGFIGYYLFDGIAMSTSFYWQELKAGESIDWDAVDAAYADWVAIGGLEPDRTIWQTSGYASFTFEDYAEVGYADFTNGQLESFYQQFYLDPGYIYYPPINLGFIGYYLFDGIAMSTSFYWQELNAGDSIDWDAVDAAYADWVAGGGLAADRTLWQTSGYASFTFEDYAEVGYTDFTGGQLESYYQQFYVDPGYILPVEEDDTPVFDIGVFKPKTGSVNYVYINGVKVGEMKVESKAFVVDGYKIIIDLNNRGSGNDVWIFNYTYEVIKL